MALAGLKPDYSNVGGGLIINGSIGWYLFKRNNWKPVIGAIFGVTTYLALNIAAGVLAIKLSQ
jgi:hypothetical protein